MWISPSPDGHLQATERVAKSLGNTATICRKCYIHPDLIDDYLDGTLMESLPQHAAPQTARQVEGLAPEEAVVLALLKDHLRRRQAEAKDESPAA